MARNIWKSILLLFFGVVVCCLIYPFIVWAIGQIACPFEANGSMVKGPDGKIVGSRLIAQPFTKDEYFQPRPSTPSYDASASASSSLAVSNYALRDRVAHTLGPIAAYKSGPKAGQPVGPDVEAWFKEDNFQGKPGIVAQWADLHNGSAQGWVKADATHGAYVDEWAKKHPDLVAKWVKDNPATPKPAATDLAVVFFEDFSKANPGKFPVPVTHKGADGKDVTTIEPASQGTDIQATFFDMWLQEHPKAELQDIPGDLVTSSASGLDPHITLQNAVYQLDRVASKWAADLKRDPAEVKKEVSEMLQAHTEAPWYGLAGEKFVNVLEVNLELTKRYGEPK
jgi:K+-transporting ATPase ATPase C chain